MIILTRFIPKFNSNKLDSLIFKSVRLGLCYFIFYSIVICLHVPPKEMSSSASSSKCPSSHIARMGLDSNCDEPDGNRNVDNRVFHNSGLIK